MVTSDPNQRSPYVSGEILSLIVAEENDPPGFLTFLSQGAALGALFAFPLPVRGLLSNDPYYGLLFIGALPWYLSIGVGFGVIEAIMIWACTYVAGHRLNVALRAGIGLAVLAVLVVVFEFLYVEPSPYAPPVSQTEYLVNIGIYVVYGVISGLVIGSRFKPLDELARGVSPPRWRVVTAITGFVLRFAVVVFLLYSILTVVWMARANTSRTEFTFAIIILSYFIAAVFTLFVRMPFWLLLPLALIVNFPVVALITDVLKPDDVGVRVFALNYLVLWAAFLSCRVTIPPAVLALIKKELRYYLISEE